jgi:hypothetical protein
MEYLVVASGVALAVGVKVVSLIWEFRDTFPRPKPSASNPTRPHGPRPGGHASRDARSSRP